MATKRICSIEGCDKPSRKRGWCVAHYARWGKHGDPLGGGKPSPRHQIAKYYRETVLNYDGDECLFWPFAKMPDGRAVMGAGYVARILCEQVNGPPPSTGYQAAHSCGNGHLACVTKRHLSWKTPKDNAADRVVHGTQTRGETHSVAKLRESEVLEIRALKGTMTHASIAARYNISMAQVSFIINRKSWSWLP